MIAVIGGSSAGDKALTYAEQLGKEIASRGAVLVCGGLGGVMEAACKGAKSMGGTTVGILPTDVHSHANQFVDIAIPTGLGYARNFLVAKSGHAVIAIDGSAGTLSEMAIAWFSDRPVVALEPSGGWAAELAGKKIDNRRDDRVYAATTPKDAVDFALEALSRDS